MTFIPRKLFKFGDDVNASALAVGNVLTPVIYIYFGTFELLDIIISEKSGRINFSVLSEQPESISIPASKVNVNTTEIIFFIFHVPFSTL